jgi:hypothetical protein
MFIQHKINLQHANVGCNKEQRRMASSNPQAIVDLTISSKIKNKEQAWPGKSKP